MKGYLKIETHNNCAPDMQGMSCECELEHVSILDKMHILHAVTHSLEMNKADVHLFHRLYNAGILDEYIDNNPACPNEQVKEEAIKAAKKEGIKVVTFDSMDDFLDHILGGDEE